MNGLLKEIGWWLRWGLFLRRCPRCRCTWELRSRFEAQDGVCHDCFAERIEEEESVR